MTSSKLSISLTPELAWALDQLAKERGEDRSSLLEILLRENPLVQRRIARGRGAVNPGTKNGRDIEKLRALGRLARRAWEEKLASGQVKLVGR